MTRIYIFCCYVNNLYAFQTKIVQSAHMEMERIILIIIFLENILWHLNRIVSLRQFYLAGTTENINNIFLACLSGSDYSLPLNHRHIIVTLNIGTPYSR